ncbi:MAG: hypothetical protein A2571_02130 [Candidatus Vogelbacteria bacterium RIFOXYD1_FULL_44_32]|uniref:Aminotransferase class V domain-containing protein n=1 Tax=Candidatus Vogelbacteria bacterium RIFOXYD1_FULL_44_32 TaxID=1802438 RepID=A0A1G2QDM3_9BACT|nr:MAG: hypothetical protein A2571_02130 [Candidatus Vogelbacteria bacterium RIFOXYD1_FULL_44_32]
MFNFWLKTKKIISADSAAATPLDRRVLKVINRVQKKVTGNPSSIHQAGIIASRELARARQTIAKNIGAEPDEIYFTSGGTESNNLAIFGVASAYEKAVGRKGKIISIATEHKSILNPITKLKEIGWLENILPVDKAGQIDLAKLDIGELASASLISVALANNEIGTLHPVRAIARLVRLARKKNNSIYPLFHVDACQAPRFFPLDVRKLGVDLLTLNSSKIYGPKGIAILYVARSISISPLLFGGGQEAGLRSGTQNVAGAVGLALALTICQTTATNENKRLSALRDLFIRQAQRDLPGIIFHGTLVDRLPNNINFTLPGVEAEWVVLWLDSQNIEASTGSACANNFANDNHILTALYGVKAPSEGSVRLSFGRETTTKDIIKIIAVLKEIPRSNV